MKEKLISIIIPAYNEETVIAYSLPTVYKELLSLDKPFEILVVDDGSKDSTLSIAQKILKSGEYPHLKLISYKDGPSRRENLSKSFTLLNGEQIILFDMDLSMDPKHLKEMLSCLNQGYEMVIPNRYHKDSVIHRTPKRYIISKLYNAFIRLLFRTGFKDNICGFKAFQREVALQLIKDAGSDTTRRRSVFWDTEIIIHAQRRGIKIKEIPISWIEGKNSALNFKREIKMLPYIMEFWFKRYQHKYNSTPLQNN